MAPGPTAQLLLSSGIYAQKWLTAVAQPRRQAIDSEMHRALRALVGLAAPETPKQLDLQVVQRVEIGKAVTQALGERRVVVQQLALASDHEQCIERALMLVGNPAENTLAYGCDNGGGTHASAAATLKSVWKGTGALPVPMAPCAPTIASAR